MKTANFGSIGSGTYRGLVETFSRELAGLVEGNEYQSLLASADSFLEAASDDSEVENALVEELQDALETVAPLYAYFGAHHGDGADFGFWLSESFESDFDGLKVNDTSEVPADYCGEVLHVNDHGNVTLYAKDENSAELREIWALV